ncbi:MAG: sporulation membrane protein YtaF [Firmicutes bacterium]|nr:sporulation membrane protein YtaF [Bacillota bacterium]
MFFVQAIVLVVALSLDALVASFSFGAEGIKIPIKSSIVIAFITTAVLAVALLLGWAFAQFIPVDVATYIASGILITVGLVKLFDSLIKGYIRRHNGLDKKINFKLFSLKFMLNIYADPIEADKDKSKVLSLAEAVGLAVILSIDSLTVGLGAGLAGGGIYWIIGLSLIFGIAFLYLGSFLGRKVRSKSKIDLSWLSGLLLIVLGIVNIFI